MRSFLRWLAVALLTTGAGVAHADRPSFADSPLAKKALRQYENLDLEGAITSFLKAAEAPGVAAKTKATALAYAGMCAMLLGNERRARELLTRAVDADPAVTLPALEASPQARDLLEQVRSARTPPPSPPPLSPAPLSPAPLSPAPPGPEAIKVSPGTRKIEAWLPAPEKVAEKPPPLESAKDEPPPSRVPWIVTAAVAFGAVAVLAIVLATSGGGRGCDAVAGTGCIDVRVGSGAP